MMDKKKLLKQIDEEIDNATSWIENEEIWDGESDMERQRKFRDMLIEIRGIVEGEPILRKLLWLRHGCSFPALYGDDGCMDCNACMIDFKDTPAEDIEAKFYKLGEKRYKEQQAQSDENDLITVFHRADGKLFISPQPVSDGLVEKIINIGESLGVQLGNQEPDSDYFRERSKAKAKIHKLIEGFSQPVITRGRLMD